MAASLVLQVLVSPLLGTVFDSLSSFAEKEFNLLSEVNDRFEHLCGILSTINDVIEDAEEKQLTDKPICKWLKELKKVTYEVQDFVDECKTDAALRHSSEIVELTIAKRIESFIRRFEAIARRRKQFHLNATAADVQSGRRQQREETSSFTVEQVVYGRDEDIKHIIELLKNDAGGNGNDNISVCAIVGMGGLGKTTLAQKIYHDERIKDRFAVKCWICVSEDFDPKRFIKTILRSLGEMAEDDQTLDNLQSRLQEKLKGKRFLVVLDDVWNDNLLKWETLKTSLSCGGKGSFVVVTTRLKTVASIMATLPHYFPGILSEEDCWSLFKQRAFTRDEELNYPELVDIGRDIVKKCCGIPLAAKALGGSLRFRRDQKQWLNVKESEIWKLQVQGDASDAILPSLQLSYKHLSSQLKQCFAYCSIFPKDHLIEKEELIFLWMANGFIQSEGDGMEVEDVGNQIFDDLSWRSFFQDFEKDQEGNITRCKMHDLMQDLACSVMGDECLFAKGDFSKAISQVSSSTRHVSYEWIWMDEFLGSFIETMLHIREFRLVAQKFEIPPHILPSIFSKLKYLRVLELRNLRISTIPDSIGNLKQLRYLNLSESDIRSLPKELCSLINLQILNLRCCYHLECFPADMRRMTNLRHLNLRSCFKITKMPIQMGKLISLQTLSFFVVVGNESGCGITELKNLRHLKGELEVRGLEHVKNATDATNSNLIQKKHLQSLELRWSTYSPVTEEEERKQLLVGEGLQPHSNLKILTISGYGGVKFPHWIGVSSYLPKLVEISLTDCHKCEHLPRLGELPLLRILRLENMGSVRCISEFYPRGDQVVPFFPSLQELYIFRMHHLGEIASSSSSSPASSSSQSISNQQRSTHNGDQAQLLSYPRLRILKIQNCPELASFISLPPSLEVLELSNTHKELVMSSLKQPLSSLAQLEITNFPNLVSFPVGEEEGEMLSRRLINLTFLSVGNCPKLETLHINKGSRHLANLQELKIHACPELEFAHNDDDDFQKLISLRNLHLSGFNKTTHLPPLPSVTSLTIRSCSGIKSLQEWLYSLTSLQILEIHDCENLNSLSGLERLTALTELRISSCYNLKSLPDEGLKLLTALKRLDIGSGNPDLYRQCWNFHPDLLV